MACELTDAHTQAFSDVSMIARVRMQMVRFISLGKARAIPEV